MVRRRTFVITGIAAVLVAGAGVGSAVAGGQGSGHHSSAAAAAKPAASKAAKPTSGAKANSKPVQEAAEVPTTTIPGLQQHLRELPGDYDSWAELGAAYENQGRLTADPTYYPKAAGALARSLKLEPKNNLTALVGEGLLANARHDFAGAAKLADQALKIDPYSADAYGVLEDAETQLGNTTAATAAAQHMLDLNPGLAAYTRVSYDFELHGNYAQAEAYMQRAEVDALVPGDVAFCDFQLGELYWNTGNLAKAQAEYSAAAKADPTSLPPIEGLGKVAAAEGHITQAIADYNNLVARYPSPPYVLEYADLLASLGRTAAAQQQYDLTDAALKLFAANGGADDLSGAQLYIAENKPAQAVAAAKREWARRHFSDVADTYAWALHIDGQDKQALVYAKNAASHGARNALYLFHRGMIEDSLGMTSDARRDLSAALTLNPHFSPRYAPTAQTALKKLEH